MTCRVLHKSLLGKNLFKHIIMGKRLIARRRLVRRTHRHFAFALY
jgi:hypothetical protein